MTGRYWYQWHPEVRRTLEGAAWTGGRWEGGEANEIKGGETSSLAASSLGVSSLALSFGPLALRASDCWAGLA